jgi:hypothetical protein
MDPGLPVLLSLNGAAILTDAAMTRINDTVYNYPFQVPANGGTVAVSLSNGTDLFGNEVVAEPLSGGSFVIMPFRPGDVNDDGMILAYDAALTLQHSVGIDPLPNADPLPWEAWRDSTANVDGSEGITANDAALILQYSVGILTSFPSDGLKSAPIAGMQVVAEQEHLVFYPYGQVLGFNMNVVEGMHLLGKPEILNPSLMSAFNIVSGMYRLGFCTAEAPEEGIAVMRIPCKGNGSIIIDVIINMDKNRLVLDLKTGLESVDPGSLRIYPNPAAEVLHVEGISREARAMVMNLQGQVLMTAVLEAPGGRIHVANLPAGLYMLKLDSGNGTFLKKFIKQ